MKLLTSFLLSVIICAGQESLASGSPTNDGIAGYNKAVPMRVEFMVHDWTTPVDGERTSQSSTYGMLWYVSGANLRLLPTNDGVAVFDIPYALFTPRRMYVIAQRDPTGGRWHVEAWDTAGVRQYSSSQVMASTGANTTGHYIRGASTNGSVGFFRIHNTLVPLNGRPPTTSNNVDRVAEWKFNNSLVDSVGSNNLTGAATYVSTPGLTTVVAVAKVNSNDFSNQTSMRAGTAVTLDGSASYSQSESTNAVTCSWHQVSSSHGHRAAFDLTANENTCSPIVRRLIFGSYEWQLTVKNGASSATTNIKTGSVATDANGVVIHANPALDDIYGPMIAFGRNPWNYADKTALRGLELRSATYANFGVGTPNWQRTDLGTVTYKVGETHLATLTSSIDSTQLTIPVSTLTGFDLTYPMIITLYGVGGNGEEVKVCGNTGTTFDVCFGGRGYNSSNRRQGAWASGERVYQRVAVGTGTSFLSLYCADGVGLDGSVTTTTGTVNVTRGSTTITGNGTGWPINNGLGGHTIRIVGAASGTPFTYYGTIMSNNATSLVTDIAYPSGADAPSGAFTYSINLRERKSFVPRFTRSVGGEGHAEFNVTHCASNTKIYFNGGYEVYTGTHTDKAFGYMDATAKWLVNAGNGSINYYGEDLANYAMWFRSGLASALTAARYVADNWLKIPDLNEWAFGSFLVPQGRNASMTGAFVRTIGDTDEVTRLNQWAALRKAGLYAVTIPTKYAGDCTGGADPRNIYYPISWLGLLAKHDPATTGTDAPGSIPWRTYWQNQLVPVNAFLDSCKATGGFEFPFTNSGTPLVQMQANNTAVGGSALTPSMCGTATGSGTATATTGSGSLTILSGTVPTNNSKIMVFGTRSGQYYAMSTGYSYSGSGPVLLGGQWPGTGGTVNWRVESDDNNTVISEVAVTTANSPMYMVACTYNSPTSITLAVPYPGTTGTYWISRSNVVGYGQQPFFTGILTFAARYATKGATGATATSLQTLTTNAATWIKDKGYDPVTNGLNYANVTPMCDPILVDANPSVVITRNTGCNYTSNSFGKQVSRELLAEAQTAFTEIYQASPTTPNRDIGDNAYAALWGQLFCSASICGDGIGNEKSYDNALDFGKWLGFQFGIGMGHQWPAVRVGGVTAPAMVTKSIKPKLTDVANAVDMVIDVIAPSGRTSTSTPCTTLACTFEVNTVEGEHLYSVRYRDAGGAQIERTSYLPVR